MSIELLKRDIMSTARVAPLEEKEEEMHATEEFSKGSPPSDASPEELNMQVCARVCECDEKSMRSVTRYARSSWWRRMRATWRL